MRKEIIDHPAHHAFEFKSIRLKRVSEKGLYPEERGIPEKIKNTNQTSRQVGVLFPVKGIFTTGDGCPTLAGLKP